MPIRREYTPSPTAVGQSMYGAGKGQQDQQALMQLLQMMLQGKGLEQQRELALKDLELRRLFIPPVSSTFTRRDDSGMNLNRPLGTDMRGWTAAPRERRNVLGGSYYLT